ncbi:MAG: CehA/McbA family metallohydrolase [Velocimicrobium sp.]
MSVFMKEKGKQRVIAVVMAIAMVITSLQLGVTAGTVTAEADGVIYSVATMEKVTEKLPDNTTKYISGTNDLGSGITISREESINFTSSTGEGSIYNNNWRTSDNAEAEKYFQIEFSTKNYENLEFTAKMKANSGTAANAFKIRYSSDGKTWNDLENGTITGVNKTLKTIGNFSLPATLADAKKVYIRIQQTDIATKTTGNTRIALISVTGNPVEGYTPPAASPEPSPVAPVAPAATTAIDPITVDDVAAVTGGALTISEVNAKTISSDDTQNTVTVIGQVATVYGSSGTLNTTILQDIEADGVNGNQIEGLQIYGFDATSTAYNYKAGDVVVLTGTLSEYKGVKQIKEFVASSIQLYATREAIPAQEIVWANVNESRDYYLSEYVVFKNASVKTVSSVAVNDASGAAITFTSAASLPSNAAVNDNLDVYGVVSKSDTTYSIRTGTTESSYIGQFTGTAPSPSPSPSATPSPTPDTLYDPVVDTDFMAGELNIKQALSTYVKGTDVTVLGQVAYVYGNVGSLKTTVIQDVIDGEIVGLEVYGTYDCQVGDVIRVTGAITDFNGVIQMPLGSIVSVIRAEKVFAPQTVTILELNSNITEYQSEYVKINNAILGATNGDYTTISDAAANSIAIYKSAIIPSDVSVGDKVTVLAVATVNTYNGVTSSQLRNGTTERSFIGDCVVDSSITLPIANWSGTSQVTTTPVYADLNAENDRLDSSANITVSTGAIPAYDVNGTTPTHIMGTKGLTNGQYYQLEFTTNKFGNVNLAFDMRGSNSGAKYFNVLYSADGINFTKSDKISYTYSVYDYSTKETTRVAKENVDTLDVITAQVSYKVSLPKETYNSSKVYIRIQVTDDSTSINGNAIGTSGVNRFMNVALTGSPVVADTITGYTVVDPVAGTAMGGQEISLTSSTEGATIYYSINGAVDSVYDASAKPIFTTFPATIVAYATKAGIEDSLKVKYNYTQVQVGTPKISPNGGAIVAGTQVKISTETKGASIQYSLDDGATWQMYTQKIKMDTFPATIMAKATRSGCIDSETKSASFTQRISSEYNVYFGQVHAHTNISDGAGTIETAFDYAKNTAEHIDFLAITDHSNMIGNLNDTATDGINVTIKDAANNEEWVKGHKIADEYTDDSFVGIYGYEMTWSGGAPGHMNTFNTDGFLSRNQDGFKNGSASSLPNYYTQLKTVTDSISQFNHPGTTFGDFYDFGYYDSEVDQLITLIEVGNGEGAIGSSGYFPSYEYYTRALDKGWHVAPTNNQDNHKGKWGDANTARTVILADTLTRDSIYDALRNMRTYATEDNDLEIQYTLNNSVMGTILDEKPDDVSIDVKLKDPTDSKIGKVEVIVNGGLSVATQDVTASQGTVDFELEPSYSYYYIRVTEADGDIAVTAPVWISEVESVGISRIDTTTSLAVKGEAVDITTTLYNNEHNDFNVDSIVYSVNDKVIHTVDLTKETAMSIVKFGKTPSYTFDYTHDGLGSTNINVTVTGTINGVQKVYKDVLKLNYVDPSMITKVIIDGTHNNDYVTGYKEGNVGNFADIAATDNVQVSIVTDQITQEMLEDCSLLIISAPAKAKDADISKDYTISHFEDEFITMVANYAKNGGNVILCGYADYRDSADCQSSTEINKLLSAMGATTRLNSDELCDDTTSGKEKYRLFLTKFNTNSAYTGGILEGQEYSAYSGCGILLDKNAVSDGTAEALVYGHETTYGLDSKKLDSNYVALATGESISLAHETIGNDGGDVFIAGTVFISDFEVKADLDNASQLAYANKNILLNILKVNKKRITATDIKTVRQGEMGEPYAIEGYVTAGTAQAGNIFFDTIYVQDDTAGITIFPIADAGIKVGQKIRIEGYIDSYQGDKELQVINYELLDGTSKVYEPLDVTTKGAMDYSKNGGRLVRVTGAITKIEIAAGDLKYIHVMDQSGVEAIVFTDGYILDSTGYTGLMKDLTVGAKVSAVGLVYTNPDGVCLRVRNRAEIIPEVISGGGAVITPTPQPTVPSTVEAIKTTISTKSITVTEKNKAFYLKDGTKITNAIVKTDTGKTYILDNTGKKYVSAMVETKSGIKFIVGETGVVVTGQIVETNGERFYTTKSSGKVVMDQLIKIDGKKYYATKTGALATGDVVTVNGDLYYTTKKSGKVVTSKLFKLDGNKYIATKSGKLATSTWIEVEGKEYYCNKSGVITKTR